MKAPSRLRLLLTVGILLTGLAVLRMTSTPDPLLAQDAKPAAKEAKQPAKPKGRLPAYYADVVSKEQREKIYTIQQAYAAKIEALEAQLKEINAKLDEEVAAVLTAEQKKKVEESAAAAKTKKAEAAKKEPAKPGEAKPEGDAKPAPDAKAAPAKPAAPATTAKPAPKG